MILDARDTKENTTSKTTDNNDHMNLLSVHTPEVKKGSEAPKPVDKPWDGPYNPKPDHNGSHGGDGRTPPTQKKSELEMQKELDIASTSALYGKSAENKSTLIAQSGDPTVDQYERIQAAKREAGAKVVNDAQRWNQEHGIRRGSSEPLINTNPRHPSAGLEMNRNPLSTGPVIYHPYNGNVIQKH